MYRRLAILLLVTLFAIPVRGQQRPMTVDDVLDLVGVQSAEISPDGQWIVYSRSSLNWKDNKRESHLWMVSTDGSAHFQFTSTEGDSAPKWSPDSQTVAFLSTRGKGGNEKDKEKEERKQIWLIRVRGGEAWKLTDHKDGISSFEWTPGGKSIAFLAADAKTEDEKTAEKQGDDAINVDEGPNGQSRGQWSNLWMIGVEDKKERPVTKEQWIISSFAISPDGKQAALHARRENQRNNGNLSEIHTVDLATGSITRITENRAPESQVQWAPDGKTIAYIAPHGREWELYNGKIWIIDFDSRKPRAVSSRYEGNINRYFWMPDGKKILFSGLHRTMQNLFELDVASGTVRQITEEAGLLNVVSFSKDRKKAAAIFQMPQKPEDLYVVDLPTLERKQVTNLNPQVKDFLLAKTEAVRWKSRDGLEIEGILYLPQDYQQGTRVPLILNIHGGPAGVWTYGFSGMPNVYTGLGYALLEPNVRGSSGYADALLRGNIKDIGGGDYWDAVTGVDAMIARGVADPDRLGVRGWSYGGILGGWTITQTNRFKAASLGAMVADWASEYAMGFNHDVRLWYIGGTPWENPQGYHKQSAYTHIAKVTTPTIILHGEQDTTDTIGQSMIFYQGLKDRGVPTRFIRFPREPHGFREPHHSRIRDTEEIAWMQKYIRGVEWKPDPRKE